MSQEPIEFTLPEVITMLGLGDEHPNQRVLDIPYVSQTCGNWCWATCATMLARSITNNNIRICQAASMLITNGNCCNDAPPEGQFNKNWNNPACNVVCSIDQVRELHVTLGMQSTHRSSAIGLDDLYQQIAVEGAPVQVAFFWYGGGGHVALVHGIDKQAQTVNVNDPWPDRGSIVVPFSQLQGAYGSGTWGDCWTNIRAIGA